MAEAETIRNLEPAPLEVSARAFEQTTLLHELERECRNNMATVRHPSVPEREAPPAADWADIRSSIEPLDAVSSVQTPGARLSNALENLKWLLLTVIPIAVGSFGIFRSKKFRD